MIIKVADKEYCFDGYTQPLQSIQQLAEECYRQGRADKLAEVKEVLATMVVNEVIDNFAYEHILVQIGAEE